MPKLRRLSGKDIVKILEGLGFSVVRIRGSHHIMKRVVDGQTQTVNVPVHGNKDLAAGMLKRMYRDLQRYIPEDDLKPHFYTD
ncbi:MAG: type II toxin-antitoxin system HicA family toxin [Chloroflexota bacterium]